MGHREVLQVRGENSTMPFTPDPKYAPISHFSGDVKSQIAEKMAQLQELNPQRAAAYHREQSLLNKSMSLAGDKALGGGMRQSTRRGFDTGLASLDNYRGRDPVRSFGSTKAEHEMLMSVTGTPVSDRRRSEIIRDLPIRAASSVELLHGLHHYNADTDHVLRHRARADPLLQPEYRERASLPVSYTPYSKRHFIVG